MSDSIRLNKYLAHRTGISRREADTLIEQGRVTVNGRVASLGEQIYEADLLSVDGRPVESHTPAYTYVLFNKPVGYVCSRRAQGDNPTIYDILPEKYRALKPVGRLDRDSSGLLLLTDDGDFAHRMTHPSFHKNKTYIVELDKPLEPLHQQMISDYGVTLEDGVSKLMIEKLNNDALHRLQGEEQDDELTSLSRRRGEPLLISMHEGRNRQIRRTFAALGYEVTRLHRTHFGNYSLDTLAVGKFTETQ